MQSTNQLDEITEYVFEILQNSNFAQEVHESFMDLAVGTGVLHVSEGDAINPINFSAIPLPHVVLDVGPNDRIDHVYRERMLDILICIFCFLILSWTRVNKIQ